MKKKIGYGEINGNAGEREISLKNLGSDEATNPISRFLNGNQQVVDTSLKQTVQAGTFGKTGIKTKNFIQKNSMDKKNGKSYKNKPGENQSVDKTNTVAIPNGVVTNNSGYMTNGYMGKGADNDGSGSESGYTTPKKRKARHNSAKGCENLNLVQDKIMQQETSAPPLKQGLETFKPDYSEQKGNQVDVSKPIWKYETGHGGTTRGKPAMGDMLCKSSDIKSGVNSKKFDDRLKGKHASGVASKEDSWTLFKPPPVFPVDNSSAKILPKLSYASKVKENLNKTVQNSSVSPSSSSSSSSSTGETQTQSSSQLSQVPMLKSVISGSFSNGPVLAYELEKRTSPQVLGSILNPGTTSESGALSLEPSHIGDLQRADTNSQGALVFLSKDYEIENQNLLASPTNTLLGSAKEQRYQRGLERNDSWCSFDPRATIVYHTKEMESIWYLQKQDPKRIITYNEAMDSPDQ
ncbi:Nuclear fragile X mental retardation-interacting protein 2 [Heterocephalus glaber]|uniref:Nuclear fragile X mental retardation-interacting protein 2 n=1 Tax=Heterocephalus glaber TaxID=10181 RepID=G5AXR3_HETGA|nr:Nuclear fragile X mental retardation-interacting protein 2 [Heterocephalus glaber]